MIALVKVLDVASLGRGRLRLRFSDGREGVRDLTDVLSEGGPMAEPLREEVLFDRVFLQSGVVTWPNGFDLDPIALHREMIEARLLSPPLAA